MRLTLACIGRLKGPEKELVERYATRFRQSGNGLGFSGLTITERVESRAATAVLRRRSEAEDLLGKLPSPATLIAFDERGKGVGSLKFSRLLATLRDDGCRDLALLIGGPDGLDPALKDQAAHILSLGAMTLPHGLARILVAEQLYRAVTILAGHPYHRA